MLCLCRAFLQRQWGEDPGKPNPLCPQILICKTSTGGDWAPKLCRWWWGFNAFNYIYSIMIVMFGDPTNCLVVSLCCSLGSHICEHFVCNLLTLLLGFFVLLNIIKANNLDILPGYNTLLFHMNQFQLNFNLSIAYKSTQFLYFEGVFSL